MAVAAVLAACSQGGGAAKEPERSSPSTASARPSGPSAQERARERVESHRQQVSALATGAATPDGEGLSVARRGTQSTTFFWSTANRLYCASAYSSTHQSLGLRCLASVKPVSRTPELSRIDEVDFGPQGGYTLLVAADRETIRAVTCGDTAVAFREVRVTGDPGAQRTVYALELEGWTAGALKVRVSRADGVHTSTLPLAWTDDEVPPDSDWYSCGAS
ncbi:hypothetical protein ACFU3O_20000 [Streptomyces antibioticus]|uniref:hypothetical protein n=1 Tax=Streptomyces antibioticus TaxID=1890 RepID=UPI00369A816C